jgi:hypothetical protein
VLAEPFTCSLSCDDVDVAEFFRRFKWVGDDFCENVACVGDGDCWPAVGRSCPSDIER